MRDYMDLITEAIIIAGCVSIGISTFALYLLLTTGGLPL